MLKQIVNCHSKKTHEMVELCSHQGMDLKLFYALIQL